MSIHPFYWDISVWIKQSVWLSRPQTVQCAATLLYKQKRAETKEPTSKNIRHHGEQIKNNNNTIHGFLRDNRKKCAYVMLSRCHRDNESDNVYKRRDASACCCCKSQKIKRVNQPTDKFIYKVWILFFLILLPLLDWFLRRVLNLLPCCQ